METKRLWTAGHHFLLGYQAKMCNKHTVCEIHMQLDQNSLPGYYGHYNGELAQ